MKHKKNF